MFSIYTVRCFYSTAREYKRMTMEMVDLQNKMRDIQNMKVTREIQSVHTTSSWQLLLS